jgi:Protein of unknown function (DUF5132)
MAETTTVAEHPEAATESNMGAAASHLQAGARHALAETGLEREGSSLATAALVGVGVAILEPELIPGLLIGAGAVLAPKLLPALGNILRPAVKGLVKAGMAVRESVAEAGEHFEDIVAEARAESGHPGNGAQTAAEPETAGGETHKRPRRQANPPGTSSHQ